MLGVPSSIEGQTAFSYLNFYDRKSRIVYDEVWEWTDLEMAFELKDCRKANRSPDAYQACSHFVPEIWAEEERLTNLTRYGIIEPPEGLGLLGWETWYVPKLTAQRDPTVLSYFGLQGGNNREVRENLSKMFLRPMSWGDYCMKVSPDNCKTKDDVAKRAPVMSDDTDESSRFFADGLYTGYFSETEKNNCDDNSTCTGHFADYPCGWGSSFQQQSYHLNISLESDGDELNSGGYSIDQLREIWRAANATRANVMMMWWTPDTLVQEFVGTDYEFQRVLLPPTTQGCVDVRVPYWETCSDDIELRVGSPFGACELAPKQINKVLSTSLLDWTYDSSIVDATRSPAYEALRLFRILDPQMGSIFDKSSEGSPRQAICEWVVENMDFVQGFVPRSYPRTIHEGAPRQALSIASLTMSIISIVAVLFTGVFVYRQRKRTVMEFAQVEFLFLLLLGLFIISVGALVVGLSPTDGSCVASIWLINIGYTIELLPLMAKVAAINRLLDAAIRMKRMALTRRQLYGAVALIGSLVTIVLIVWTVVDPPQKIPEYDLTDTAAAEGGETIVTVSYYCSAEMDLWRYMSVAWFMLLLICATVLAVQARNQVQQFNESRTLAIMIYSHFFFLVLRVLIFFLEDVLSRHTLTLSQSLIYSVDVIATIGIYFIPKFIENGRRTLNPIPDMRSAAFHTDRSPSRRISGLDLSDGKLSGGNSGDRLILAFSDHKLSRENSRDRLMPFGAIPEQKGEASSPEKDDSSEEDSYEDSELEKISSV